MQKILVIAYYWPPAGGPGVQRWLNFVKYLRDFNIDPVVYVPENPTYPILDESLVKQVPQGIAILKRPIFEPYGLARLFSPKKTKRISSGIIQTKHQSGLEKLMLWIRGNLFIPDARKYWVKPSVNYLLGPISEHNIKTVITTGPPHSVHLIGNCLKKRLDLQWIADFRDPWTSIGYHKKLKLTRTSQKKHKALEKEILNAADKIIVTSNTTRREFLGITKRPITVITNGFDTDYTGGGYLDERFTISHIGSLLTGRNPENLWRALSELARENEVFRKDLQLEFMGVVSQDVLDTIYRYELAPYVVLKGYGSHAEAVRKQRSSQILLLVEIDSSETIGIIPGKLFEYMAAKRPILAMGPKEWEVSGIIAATDTGVCFDYRANASIKKVLLDWYDQFKKNRLTVNSQKIERYSRKELTKKLAEFI